MGRSIQSVVIKTLQKRDQRQNIGKGYMNENLGGTGTAQFTQVPSHHTQHEPGGSDEIVGIGGTTTFSAIAPVGPALHDVWVNTTANTESYWDGANWILIISITTAPGIYSTTGLPLIVNSNVNMLDVSTLITSGAVVEELTDKVNTENTDVTFTSIATNITTTVVGPEFNPLFVSAETNATGTKVIVKFDKNMSATFAAAPAGFAVTMGGGNTNNPVVIVALNGDITKIDLTLTTGVTHGTTNIKVAYTKGTVSGTNTCLLESFAAQTVTNMVP